MVADVGKLEQAVVFFVSRSKHRRLSASTLWVLLYFLDAEHTRRYGTAVCGLVFTKGAHGPQPTDGLVWLDRWAARSLITVRRIRRFRGVQCLLEHPVMPDLTAWDFTERAVLEEMALDWLGATSRQIHRALREDAAWRRASAGEPLVPSASA